MSEKSGKLIAVWGSPHSGKTTFAAFLATAIADTYAAATVIVLYSDIEALNALGYDIQLRRGRNGGYWMARCGIS